jgi:GDP-L-fucose synthase
VYLGKCLEKQNFEEIRKDLDKNPIENIDGKSSKEEIIEKLSKYGVSFNINTNKVQIEIWGTGMPKREFMYSKDMADACVYIMENIDFADTYGSNLKEIRNTHINIGTGKDISIKELSQLVKTTIGFNGDFYFDKNKPDGTMIKLTDPSKLHSLGWKHKIELEDGIKKMYEWYQEENNK